jgi:hypothetical protein
MVADTISEGGNGASKTKETGIAKQIPDILKREAGKDRTGSDGLAGGYIKVINKSSFSNELIRAVIRFVRPPGIRRFTAEVRDCKGYIFRGHGGRKGVLVKINPEWKFPCNLYVYQYGQLKSKWTKADPVTGVMRRRKGRRYHLASKTEALIYVMAHELMHTKQGQSGRIRGKVWGARGRYSEIQTESYAIRKLREYRRAT